MSRTTQFNSPAVNLFHPAEDHICVSWLLFHVEKPNIIFILSFQSALIVLMRDSRCSSL